MGGRLLPKNFTIFYRTLLFQMTIKSRERLTNISHVWYFPMADQQSKMSQFFLQLIGEFHGFILVNDRRISRSLPYIWLKNFAVFSHDWLTIFAIFFPMTNWNIFLWPIDEFRDISLQSIDEFCNFFLWQISFSRGQLTNVAIFSVMNWQISRYHEIHQLTKFEIFSMRPFDEFHDISCRDRLTNFVSFFRD